MATRVGDEAETVLPPAEPVETIEQILIPNQYIVTEPEIMPDVLSLADGISFEGEVRKNFTQEMAREFFSRPEFDGERPFRPRHAAYLMGLMKQGLFRPESVEIITCYCKSSKQTYRLNGKHTAAAVGSMKKGFFLKNVSFLHYHAANEDVMRTLYTTIDNGAPRTQGNMLLALIAGTPDFRHFTQGTITSLGEAIAYWKWPKGNDRIRHKANDRARLLTGEYKNLALLIGEFLQQDNGERAEHMNRSPVQSAMFATYDVAIRGKKGAVEFWTHVRDGTSMAAGDPRLLLRDKLQKTSLREGNSSVDRKRAGREEMLRWCYFAWNAWREGRELLNLKGAGGSAASRPALV